MHNSVSFSNHSIVSFDFKLSALCLKNAIQNTWSSINCLIPNYEWNFISLNRKVILIQPHINYTLILNSRELGTRLLAGLVFKEKKLRYCHHSGVVGGGVQYWTLVNWKNNHNQTATALHRFEIILRYLRTLRIVWGLVRCRVSRRLTRLPTMHNVH